MPESDSEMKDAGIEPNVPGDADAGLYGTEELICPRATLPVLSAAAVPPEYAATACKRCIGAACTFIPPEEAAALASEECPSWIVSLYLRADGAIRSSGRE